MNLYLEPASTWPFVAAGSCVPRFPPDVRPVRAQSESMDARRMKRLRAADGSLPARRIPSEELDSEAGQ
jgi:hypothetical protein